MATMESTVVIKHDTGYGQGPDMLEYLNFKLRGSDMIGIVSMPHNEIQQLREQNERLREALQAIVSAVHGKGPSSAVVLDTPHRLAAIAQQALETQEKGGE